MKTEKHKNWNFVVQYENGEAVRADWRKVAILSIRELNKQFPVNGFIK